jgi:hypothetical protein
MPTFHDEGLLIINEMQTCLREVWNSQADDKADLNLRCTKPRAVCGGLALKSV